MTDFDVAMVGLGAMGSATLYQLAKRGVRAIGVDRFDPPHASGSSHGDTRITRRAVGEGAAYAPFVIKSHDIWRELEAETGEPLLVECGALIMAPADQPNSHHGKPDFLGKTVRCAERYGIEHEVLDADAIQKRFPHYQQLRAGDKGYFEPGGGYVMPERCIAAQLARAEALGARVVRNTPVESIAKRGDAVRLTTADGPITAGQAVVAAGPWTAPLLGPPFDSLLTVNRQVLHWFELDDPTQIAADCPVAIWMHGPGDTDYFYSFPPRPGENSMKVATEQYDVATTADAVDRRVSAEESAEMFDRHVKNRIAGVSPRVAKTAACAYTVTPDLGFIFGRQPANERVLVVSACSGHGFKHSAGIGHAVADAVSQETGDIELSSFALERFA